MSDLASQTPANTYKGLLQVNDYTNGVDATAKYVQDGEGTDSALAISTTAVGIGTASPDAKLVVETDSSTYSLDTDDFSQVGLLIKSNTTEGIGNKGGSIAFTALTGAGGKHAAITAVQTDVDSNNVGLAFEVHQGGTSGDPLVEAMRIDRNGKVGIGTTSPGSKLAVFDSSAAVFRLETPGVIAISHSFDGTDYTINNNDGSSGHPIIFGTKTAGAESMRIDSSGNVGIGTASPSAPLAINASPYPHMSFDNSQTDSVAGTNIGAVFFKGRQPDGSLDTAASIKSFGTGTAGNESNNVPGNLVFQTNPGGTGGLVQRMTIDSDGNCGIGTASPTAPLEVSSTTGGVIMPRMTTAEMNAISSPTDGEMIYNTTANKFYGRASGSWVALH